MNQTHYVYWIRGAEFVELAQMSIDSVRKVDPTAKVHIWTDEPATTPRPKDVAYHTLPSGRPAMVANLDAQIAALNYLQRGERVLFLDADTLMRKPFPWALAPDLYVTWRGDVNGNRELAILQPYNYGVVGAHVNAATLEAFYWLRARIFQMNRRNQDWYGNQFALAELVGSPPKDGTADKDVRVRWAFGDSGSPLMVRQLPCDMWNYSPNAEDEDINQRGIVHVKGDRKDWMRRFAEAA